MKYSVIVGKAQSNGHFIGLRVVGITTTIEKARSIADSKMKECNGLLIIVDLSTGKEATI